jgi:hypothetical protein
MFDGTNPFRALDCWARAVCHDELHDLTLRRPTPPVLVDLRRAKYKARNNELCRAASSAATQAGVPLEEVEARLGEVVGAVASLWGEDWWNRSRLDAGAAGEELVRRLQRSADATAAAMRLADAHLPDFSRQGSETETAPTWDELFRSLDSLRVRWRAIEVEPIDRVRGLLTRLLASCAEAVGTLKRADDSAHDPDDVSQDNQQTAATNNALQEVLNDQHARTMAPSLPAEVLGGPQEFRSAALALSWVVAVERWAQLFLANLDAPKELPPTGNDAAETQTAGPAWQSEAMIEGFYPEDEAIPADLNEAYGSAEFLRDTSQTVVGLLARELSDKVDTEAVSWATELALELRRNLKLCRESILGATNEITSANRVPVKVGWWPNRYFPNAHRATLDIAALVCEVVWDGCYRERGFGSERELYSLPLDARIVRAGRPYIAEQLRQLLDKEAWDALEARLLIERATTAHDRLRDLRRQIQASARRTDGPPALTNPPAPLEAGRPEAGGDAGELPFDASGFAEQPVDGTEGSTSSLFVIPPLSDLQYEILRALHGLRATSAADRQPSDAIANRIPGKPSPAVVREAAKTLVGKWIGSKSGRTGGYWLVEDGVYLVDRLQKR